MDDLLSIGEFSDRCGLSPKRLRTYAEGGLLVPAAVDPSSGYRYYSPHQVRQARLIDALRSADIPLADIDRLLRDPAQQRLDDWSRRLQSDAVQRQKALDLARHLLAAEATSIPHPPDQQPGEAVMTTLRSTSRTDIGLVREKNEDSVLSSDRMAVVADGMGGHPGGEVASALAVSLVQAAFSGRSLHELEAAVRAANRAVWDRAKAQPELAGMGSTICAAGLTHDDRLVLVHVGDSRTYLLRNGSLQRLTQDHSLTADLVRTGELAEAEARDHPLHGIITRALGVGPDVELESSTHDVVPGDRLLVCSDGLHNEVALDELTAHMSLHEDVLDVADELIQLALTRGAPDNVSVVVAEVTAGQN